jgi:prepilin-type N-terminal cleavage/methylation domain-containing protein
MTRQRGFSLIETTVAIALLTIIVVAILSAFGATTLAATRHQQEATLDRLVRSDAEYIKSQAYSTKPAAYTNLAVAGYGFSYQVLYYDSTQNPVFATTHTDNGLQELLLTVTGPNGSSELLYFLKVQP